LFANHHMLRRSLVVVAATAVLGAGATPTAVHAATSIPWGTVLVSGSQWAGADAALGDLNVYSNGTLNTDQAGPFGLEYECTELVQRWAHYKFGEPAIWPISKAADMWTAGPTLPLPLTQNPNGGARPPQYGDILVFAATTANPTGHTAVVSAVTSTSVTSVQQNLTVNGTPTGQWTQSLNGTTVASVGGDPVLGWLRLVLPPGGGVHLAPLAGSDQASYAIAVTDNGIKALSPGAASFGSPLTWSTTPFYGSRATLFARLDGAAKPEAAVAINGSSIWVMKNLNSTFGPPTAWSTVPFYGSRATLMADVDGSGVASAVAINDKSIWVMRVNSTKDGFEAPQRWSSSLFYGSRGTFMADVDGSGRASAVAINDNSIWVMPNRGGQSAAFGPPQLRATGAFYGNRGTFMADLDGPGQPASAVAMNDSNIWVKKNDGAGTFLAPSAWSNQPFHGAWQYMADVNGSGRASAIAVTGDAIWVEQNTGAAFLPPTRWFGAPFYGTH
jgi:CHAP domain